MFISILSCIICALSPLITLLTLVSMSCPLVSVAVTRYFSLHMLQDADLWLPMLREMWLGPWVSWRWWREARAAAAEKWAHAVSSDRSNCVRGLRLPLAGNDLRAGWPLLVALPAPPTVEKVVVPAPRPCHAHALPEILGDGLHENTDVCPKCAAIPSSPFPPSHVVPVR